MIMDFSVHHSFQSAAMPRAVLQMVRIVVKMCHIQPADLPRRQDPQQLRIGTMVSQTG